MVSDDPRFDDKLAEIRTLEASLCPLAGEWYQHPTPQRDEGIVQQYHEVFRRLYELGWDKILEYECELPDNLMPKEYLRRHPTYPAPTWGGIPIR